MSKNIWPKWEKPIVVDDDKFEELSKIDWYISISRGKPYARRHTQKSRPVGETYMHRLIVNCPVGMITHHKDRNTLNNRVENLQIMSQEEHENLYKPKNRPLLKPDKIITTPTTQKNVSHQ